MNVSPREVYYSVKDGIPHPVLSANELHGIVASAVLHLNLNNVEVNEASLLGAIHRKLSEAGAWSPKTGFAKIMFDSNVTSRGLRFLVNTERWMVDFIKSDNGIWLTPPRPDK